jgi:hypothetical protein
MYLNQEHGENSIYQSRMELATQSIVVVCHLKDYHQLMGRHLNQSFQLTIGGCCGS